MKTFQALLLTIAMTTSDHQQAQALKVKIVSAEKESDDNLCK